MFPQLKYSIGEIYKVKSVLLFTLAYDKINLPSKIHNPHQQDGFLQFEFEGKGFLKHMVRNFIGTLVYVGRKKIPARQVKTILEARNRCDAGPTAPAEGLCLVKVWY